MPPFGYVALGALVLAAFCFNQGYGIKCFTCNSHNDTRCELEVLPDDLKTECSSQLPPPGKPYILCRKIKQVIDFEVNGLQPDSRVIRGCGWDDTSYKNRCYQRSGFGGRQEVCACETDYCNSSVALYSSTSLLMGVCVLLKSLSLFLLH